MRRMQREHSRDGAVMVWVPTGAFVMGTAPEDARRLWAAHGWGAEWLRYAEELGDLALHTHGAALTGEIHERVAAPVPGRARARRGPVPTRAQEPIPSPPGATSEMSKGGPVPTFIMLTRIAPQALTDPAQDEALGRRVEARLRQPCPQAT
jgi:hypothetical protein